VHCRIFFCPIVFILLCPSIRVLWLPFGIFKLFYWSKWMRQDYRWHEHLILGHFYCSKILVHNIHNHILLIHRNCKENVEVIHNAVDCYKLYKKGSNYGYHALNHISKHAKFHSIVEQNKGEYYIMRMRLYYSQKKLIFRHLGKSCKQETCLSPFRHYCCATQ
jgi:hypothetical protein